MKDEPPTQPPPSEAITFAQDPAIGVTATGFPGTLSSAAGPAPGAVPAELSDHPRYRVLELMGQGGMGAVFKAEHRHMGRNVALKVINPALMGSDATVRRFHQEVQAAARLHHPNIVTAYDADQASGLHFLVMELLEGECLDQFVRRKPDLTVAEACDYTRQAALGLQHAHEQGMVHRDIKPQNLMRTPDGRIKILDFGLARLAHVAEDISADQTVPTSSQLTAAGAVMGTADYIAPEQAGDARSADVRADIYSLGCTLYQLLTGRVPFPGGSALDKLKQHAKDEPAEIARLRPGLPSGLAAIVRKMMAKEPTARFQTPAQVAEALAPFTAPPRRGRRMATACALVLTIAAVLYVVIGKPFERGSSTAPNIPPDPPVAAAPPKSGKAHRPAVGEGVPAKYRESINRGLAYLAKEQHSDGHWESVTQYSTSMTALAGMALLMEGSTLEDGNYAEHLRKAVRWLTEHAQPNGLIGNPADRSEISRYLFGHGQAMLFLATVYEQEEDGERRRQLEAILTKAVEFTASAQSTRGGWGYVRASDGGNFDEGASTIVQLQALRAARNSGIAGSKNLIDLNYLRKCTTPQGGIIYSIGLVEDKGRPALTAAALACMYTSGDYDSELAKKWIVFYRQNKPVDKPDQKIGHDVYAEYYCAQARYLMGEIGYEKLFPRSKPAERLTWSNYRETTFNAMLASQAADGSWNVGGIGPVYATACYLTILQLDNNAVQIYRR